MLEHDLGKDEARKRVSENFDQLKSAVAGGMLFKFKEEWSGDQMAFTAKGM